MLFASFSFLFHAIQIILHEQRSSAKPARTTPVLIIFKGLTITQGIIGDFLAFSLRTYSVSMFSLSWRKNLVEEQSVSLPAHHHYLAFTTALWHRHKKTTSTSSPRQEDALTISLKNSPLGKKQGSSIICPQSTISSTLQT